MRGRNRSYPIAQAASPLRRLALLCLALAFGVQAYLVQTHLHGQPGSSTPLVQIAASQPAPSGPVDPLDPATCRLCQEIVHAGAILTPTVSAPLILLNWIAVAPFAPLLPATAVAPETGWQGRAPPRH